ncbi:hypothetical protein RJ639_031877 [Escallonia herrerae]|uniref:Uncharacterized protein n=1 Tax=Escallonia herrerae TaxID=1293975 RepID=A0AA88X0U0_9ASTE|nr:hypothetical protein RJ639_031877 [Escallonia herrerae]
MASKQQKRNYIAGLEDKNGVWRKKRKELEEVVVDYVEDLFTSNPQLDMRETLEAIGNRVDREMNNTLVEEFNHEEIRTALFQMHPTKAPGLHVHQSIVKVLPSKVSVTCCGLHFNYTLFNSEKRDIKSTTTKIENENILCTNISSFLLHTISEGSICWLIDDSLYIETSNSSSILGCLALGVIEIGRDSDHSILYFCPEKCLGNLAHLNHDHGRYLLGGKLLLLTFVTDHNHGLVSRTRSDLKWPELDITLCRCITESPTNQSLCICHALKQQRFP